MGRELIEGGKLIGLFIEFVVPILMSINYYVSGSAPAAFVKYGGDKFLREQEAGFITPAERAPRGREPLVRLPKHVEAEEKELEKEEDESEKDQPGENTRPKRSSTRSSTSPDEERRQRKRSPRSGLAETREDAGGARPASYRGVASLSLLYRDEHTQSRVLHEMRGAER